ncbi:MAG: hypothetical protein ACAI44_08325, partial [Candidatus Sericytochromatia bacterium]
MVLPALSPDDASPSSRRYRPILTPAVSTPSAPLVTTIPAKPDPGKTKPQASAVPSSIWCPDCRYPSPPVPKGGLIAPLDLFGSSAKPVKIYFGNSTTYPAGTDQAALRAIAQAGGGFDSPFSGGLDGGIRRAVYQGQDTLQKLIQAFYPGARIEAKTSEGLRFTGRDGRSYEASYGYDKHGCMVEVGHLEVKPAAAQPEKPRFPAPAGLEAKPSSDGRSFSLSWDYHAGQSLEDAIRQALGEVTIGQAYGEHPMTYYDVTTAGGERWKLSW